MTRGFSNPTFGAILAAILLAVSGCASEKPVAVKPPLAPPAKVAKTSPSSEPSYPEPDIDDEEDEPNVDATALGQLVGDWVWLGTATPLATHKVDKPSLYRMTVYPRGWFALSAGCMKVEGVFEAHGSQIAFAVVQHSSGLGCTAPPLLDEYVGTLEAARGYRLVGERLRLRMKNEKKEMVFYRSR
jgi:hypothetical protein